MWRKPVLFNFGHLFAKYRNIALILGYDFMIIYICLQKYEIISNYDKIACKYLNFLEFQITAFRAFCKNGCNY